MVWDGWAEDSVEHVEDAAVGVGGDVGVNAEE